MHQFVLFEELRSGRLHLKEGSPWERVSEFDRIFRMEL